MLRKANIERKTKETDIKISLNLDGTGAYSIRTSVPFMDHMFSHIARHGFFDLTVKAKGDTDIDDHHTVEDLGIAFGQALKKALGDSKGIRRYGEATVPMDETLATVAVDISGRGYSVLKMEFSGNDMSGFPADLVRHFLESFAIEAGINLHASIVYGTNDHHKAEALFKALGRALDKATRIDERIAGELPSTKDYLES